MVDHFDCIVVGGGPGGYVAAIRAAQLGLHTALVEREHLGGICLNWGCIPTKSLLHTADVYREIANAESLGINVGSVDVDLSAVVARSRAVANQLCKGIGMLMRKNKVTVFDGQARLDGPGRLRVSQQTQEAQDGAGVELTAGAIILATGARPKSLPNIEIDGQRIWSYREAMVPTELPRRLLVIGAGAIGIEFASFYHTLGSEVTVVEVLPQVLPVEDDEIAGLARAAFDAQGIEIHTGAKVLSVTPGDAGLVAEIETATGVTRREFDRAILSVGVAGNVEDLGLETTAVVIDGGFIRVDGYQETAEPGIFAIGDVAGVPCLAHKASHEGMIAAEYIADEAPHPLKRDRIPGCTYCHPQVASVGLTERAAAESNRQVKIGRFPLIGNGKAIAIGDSDGLVKTIFDAATGELLGAHMVGPGVTEMIQGFVVAMGLETTESELIDTIFPHPTVSEAMHESVLAAFDRALHF
jgi:dihydrolipoamide dehydrogenase